MINFAFFSLKIIFYLELKSLEFKIIFVNVLEFEILA